MGLALRCQTTAARVATRKSKEPVPDDWDADDGEEEEDSQTVWEKANKRAPIPEFVIKPSSTTTTTTVIPPAALKAPMKILKRPNSASSSSTPASSTSSSEGRGKTLAEREKQYEAARQRIFGDSDIPVPSLAQGQTQGQRMTAVQKRDPSSEDTALGDNSIIQEGGRPPVFVRNPRGPQSPAQDGEVAKGFERGRGGSDWNGL